MNYCKHLKPNDGIAKQFLEMSNSSLMANVGRIYCFRASYECSTLVDKQTLPDWISVSANWQGYRISTVPWVTSVAQVLGTVQLEDTALGWKVYLESLGFGEVTLVGCEDLFEDTLYC